MKAFWSVLITIVLTAVIVGSGSYYYMKIKNDKDKSDLSAKVNSLTNEVNALKGTSSESTVSTSTDSSGKSSTANLDMAKEVTKNFLDAKKTRGLTNAKPYTTDAWYKATNQEEFAGVSSPSMGRFIISKAEYLSAADLYKITATVYQNLQSEEVGYSVNSYMVVDQNGNFLVNEVKEGDFQEMK
jgi:hypothetical protein